LRQHCWALKTHAEPGKTRRSRWKKYCILHSKFHGASELRSLKSDGPWAYLGMYLHPILHHDLATTHYVKVQLGKLLGKNYSEAVYLLDIH
jgi:hypothetical protein